MAASPTTCIPTRQSSPDACSILLPDFLDWSEGNRESWNHFGIITVWVVKVSSLNASVKHDLQAPDIQPLITEAAERRQVVDPGLPFIRCGTQVYPPHQAGPQGPFLGQYSLVGTNFRRPQRSL